MVVKYEEVNVNEVKVYIESTPEQVEKLIADAYRKNKNKYNVKGFRPGKAPQKIIEQMYGVEVFLSDAFDLFVNKELLELIEEKQLETYGEPKVSDVVVEKDRMSFSAEIKVFSMPKFAEYKGIEIPDLKAEVTDEEIETEIRKEIKKNSRLVEVTDRAAQNGDKLTIDFVGTVDGVAFEGGTAENVDLTIGEGRFIPGFEEQLIGAAEDSDVTVKVTFPEDYGAADLAGKDAEFAVKVHDIKTWEEPEFNDEFVSDISEFETVDEYKASVKEKLMEQKAFYNKKAKEDHAVATFVKNTELSFPEGFVEESINHDKEGFANRLQSYGLTIEGYAQMMGKTEEEMLDEMAAESKKHLVETYVLVKLAQQEKIEFDKDQLDDIFKLKAAQYKMSDEEFRNEIQKRPGMLQYIYEEALKEAAIKLIMDNTVLVDPEKLPKEEELTVKGE